MCLMIGSSTEGGAGSLARWSSLVPPLQFRSLLARQAKRQSRRARGLATRRDAAAATSYRGGAPDRRTTMPRSLLLPAHITRRPSLSLTIGTREPVPSARNSRRFCEQGTTSSARLLAWSGRCPQSTCAVA